MCILATEAHLHPCSPTSPIFPVFPFHSTGCHTMEIAHSGRAETIKPVRGHAVFVPDHAWNKPDWSAHVEALTFLFGVKQIGISLVRHKGTRSRPHRAEGQRAGRLRCAHAQHSGRAHGAGRRPCKGPLARLLTESLLHACLRLLKSPQKASTAQGDSHL